MKRGNSEHLQGIKNRIFRMVLIISALSFMLISFVNLFNKRPLVNFAFPFIASFMVMLMYRVYHVERYSTFIKSIYLIFLCILYLPAAWLTSPGSYSAMSFYAILILFIAIILAEKNWEYIFPIIVIVETIVLLNYEPLVPDRYTLYSDPYVRAIDLTINYFVVCIIMFSILFVLNTYFDKEHNKIFTTAITDPLTGLYNRRYIYDQLESFYDQFGNVESKFSLIMIDINNFKKVNDNYGHNEGDKVLVKFAEILNEASRKNDLVGRYGGDEFLLILSDSDEKNAKLVEDRIVDLFSPLAEKYRKIGLSLACGISESSNYSISDIVKIADDRLYNDKSNKKSSLGENINENFTL